MQTQRSCFDVTVKYRVKGGEQGEDDKDTKDVEVSYNQKDFDLR